MSIQIKNIKIFLKNLTIGIVMEESKILVFNRIVLSFVNSMEEIMLTVAENQVFDYR